MAARQFTPKATPAPSPVVGGSRRKGSDIMEVGHAMTPEEEAAHEHGRLVHEYAALKLGALGPEREVDPAADKFVTALVTPTADLSREQSALLDLCLVSGPHGSGVEGRRVRTDAARYLYDAGAWRLLERLAEADAEIRALCAWEIHHAGRPHTDAALFANYGPSGEQFAPVVVQDA